MPNGIFRYDKAEKLRTSERGDPRQWIIPFGLEGTTAVRSRRKPGVSSVKRGHCAPQRPRGMSPRPLLPEGTEPLRAESWHPQGEQLPGARGRRAGDTAPARPPSGEGADDESGSRWRGFRTAPPHRCVDGYCELLGMAMEGQGRPGKAVGPSRPSPERCRHSWLLVGRGTPQGMRWAAPLRAHGGPPGCSGAFELLSN